MKWEDRIIEIREGSWSYVAGSIGRAPGMFYIAIYMHFVDCLHRNLRQLFVKNGAFIAFLGTNCKHFDAVLVQRNW